ncbi:MAG: hypothetical protein CGU29_14980 [Candidatus Dactylopiibacterium carminicum]|uniref:Prepilin-type cleavage/methylation domain-containing protein n=1 Tax=Candidatus Dactylopiibacterium carminicum TaxID=857335 RepID=A0A272ENL5_9RHOO|nr:PilW family protein [Candidatus Dactylopiibacterium carminicum]KAF7599153.1 hypothetical protein BGI27_09515 [Candidatus Dactylopiibacterium carminicum]PAS91693.1 MAG: hypothetical protein CGU29_14980 [Candidatus Dactylopiibacterium carminicum]PAS99141.1 MAG: hypothetical protein BSR46_09540 [Candidatus Dactylopiibacterium carminicum]
MTKPPQPQRGITLIELMVALVIASLLAIAVASVLASYEGHKRTTTSVNDINQSGNYAAWTLDSLLRSAGSGFALNAPTIEDNSTQLANLIYGCKILASKNGSTVLPRSSALPAPFADIDQTFRLAPVLILQDGSTPTDSGNDSDILIIMGGTSGKAEAPAYLDDYPASDSLELKNTLSFSASDLALLTKSELGSSGVQPCFLTQVSTSFVESGSGSLTLGGDYYAATISGQEVSGYAKHDIALNIGNIANGNTPVIAALGVGDNSTLFSYDLLQSTAAPLQAIASGVFELHALYGLDTNGDGKVDSWSKPENDFAYAALTTGSSAAASNISQIKAIRVGLILRTSLLEKEAPNSPSLTLFSDLGSDLAYSPALSTDNTLYRYRTMEFNVPLRNPMLLE